MFKFKSIKRKQISESLCPYKRKCDLSYSNKFLLSKEAHCDIIPQWSTFWSFLCCYSVLRQSNIEVTMRLHHTACCKNCLCIGYIVCQGISEVFKCFLVLANLVLQQFSIEHTHTIPTFGATFRFSL